jgi:DNA end-binding protein Ku
MRIHAHKRKAQTRKPTGQKRAFSRPMWKGSIDFGLVSIPVALYPAETSSGIEFDLLDKRDFSRVRYRRVNEKTGREVPWDQIVRGYQYKKGEYVAMTDQDFRNASVEGTRSIDITRFVDGSEISPLYYDTPYYLGPLKNGRRAYALLRDVMKKTGKAGVAKIVIRTRQHLAVLLVQGDVLVLNLVRFAHELHDASTFDVPEADSKAAKVSRQEVNMAEQLVATMAGKWNPKIYRDDYRDDVLKLIERKVHSGQTKTVEPAEPAARPKRIAKVVDIMHLLRQSVEDAKRKGEPEGRRKAN